MDFDLLPPSSSAADAPHGPPAPLGPLSAALAAPEPPPATGHRASCHRCGNMRKGILKCRRCPSTWCARCAERLAVEHGAEAFVGGCPLCLGLCCCSDERGARVCGRLYHCYKKVRGRPCARRAALRRAAPRCDAPRRPRRGPLRGIRLLLLRASPLPRAHSAPRARAPLSPLSSAPLRSP